MASTARGTACDGLNNPTTYTFDSYGNVTSVEDPLGNTTLYDRNPSQNEPYTGLVNEMDQPQVNSGGTMTVPVTLYGYDANSAYQDGNLTSETLPDGTVEHGLTTIANGRKHRAPIDLLQNSTKTTATSERRFTPTIQAAIDSHKRRTVTTRPIRPDHDCRRRITPARTRRSAATRSRATSIRPPATIPTTRGGPGLQHDRPGRRRDGLHAMTRPATHGHLPGPDHRSRRARLHRPPAFPPGPSPTWRPTPRGLRYLRASLPDLHAATSA